MYSTTGYLQGANCASEEYIKFREIYINILWMLATTVQLFLYRYVCNIYFQIHGCFREICTSEKYVCSVVCSIHVHIV